MDSHQLAESLLSFATGNLCNAHHGVRAMQGGLTPLFEGITTCGPAKTARIRPGQNAAIHHAVHTAKTGEVLVVEAGGDRGHGPFGDILATCCLNQGIRGLVIDGTIRDSAEIKALGFPVFCLGTNPTATAKSDPGEIDCLITCGGCQVRPGDLILGDGDGVVVIPQGIAAEVLERAEAVVRREEEIQARLAAGETTFQIFGLDAK